MTGPEPRDTSKVNAMTLDAAGEAELKLAVEAKLNSLSVLVHTKDNGAVLVRVASAKHQRIFGECECDGCSPPEVTR